MTTLLLRRWPRRRHYCSSSSSMVSYITNNRNNNEAIISSSSSSPSNNTFYSSHCNNINYSNTAGTTESSLKKTTISRTMTSFSSSLSSNSNLLRVFSTTATTVATEDNIETSSDNNNMNKSNKNNDTNTNNSTSNTSAINTEKYRKLILQTSLKEVHEYGWTNDAISSAVVDVLKLPPSMIGLINNNPEGGTLVSYFMNECNTKFKNEMMQQQTSWTSNNANSNNNDNDNNSSKDQRKETTILPTTMLLSERIELCIKKRLEYVIPYVRSNRWSEGMAIGVTKTPTSTVQQIHDVIEIIASTCVTSDEKPLSFVEKLAIGSVYISTELFLLTDTSPNYIDTWTFLHERCKTNELQNALSNNNINSVLSSMNGNGYENTIAASSAVLTSLGSAIVSLVAQPTTTTTNTARSNIISSTVSTIILPALTKLIMQKQQQSTTTTTTTSDDNNNNGNNDDGGEGTFNDGNFQKNYSSINNNSSNLMGTKPSDY